MATSLWASDLVENLAQAAAQGSTAAMLSLARIYADRESKPFSMVEAKHWYAKAAAAGEPRAQRALGALYELAPPTERDYKKAAYWYQKAAIQGLARAQTNLGKLYETGQGVGRDLSEALRWYRAAARQGYARAQVYIGDLYRLGMGVEASPKEAVSWYRKAAIQDYSPGQVRMGQAYEDGLISAANLDEARRWYAKAARKGYPPAREALKRVEKLLTAGKAEHPAEEPRSLTAPTPVVPPIRVRAADVDLGRTLADYEIKAKLQGNEEGDNSFLAALMESECSDYNLDYLQRQTLEAQAEMFDTDPGLKFESGYRLREGDTTDERQRLYAGLSWDLFNDGILENKSKARRAVLEQKISEIRAAQARRKELFDCRDTYLIHTFNNYKEDLLEKRARVMAQLYELSRKMYFAGDLLADDLLKVELEKARVQKRLAAYRELAGEVVLNRQIFDDRKPPRIVGLNLDRINQAVRSDPIYKELQDLSIQILKERYNPLYEKRLRLYTRAGIDEDQGSLSSGDVTGGVYFNTPLLRDRQATLESKIAQERGRIRRERQESLRHAARLYNSYNEKLGDAVNLAYHREIVVERLRRSLISLEENYQKTGGYNLRDYRLLLEELQTELGARMAFVGVQESLFRRLLHLFTLLSQGYQDDFVSKIDLKLPLERGRHGRRALYMWSKAFMANDNHFILDLLRAKGVGRLIVSAGTATDRLKLSDFLEAARLNGIEVELMVSENSWISPEKWPKVRERIDELARMNKVIHLDIEPHTLKGYKERRQEYDGLYAALVEKISARCRELDVELNVALPPSASQELVARVGTVVHNIYLMAYGSISMDGLEKRLQNFVQIPKDRLVLVQRAADFSSELAMEERLDAAWQQLPVGSFAIHDFKGWARLLEGVP